MYKTDLSCQDLSIAELSSIMQDFKRDQSRLPSWPFFLRVSVPTQPSLPESFFEASLFNEPVGELGSTGEDAMFVTILLVSHEPSLQEKELFN